MFNDSWDGQKAPIVLEKYNNNENISNYYLNSWEGNNLNGIGNDRDYEITGSVARMKFREFFRNYRFGNVYYYREALLRHWTQGLYYIEVDLAHIFEFDDVLLNCLQVSYYYYFDYLYDYYYYLYYIFL